jgi:hypothetical protein
LWVTDGIKTIGSKKYPTKADLDAAFPVIPCLNRVDGHAYC